MSEALTAHETYLRERLERTIRRDRRAFIRAGLALAYIRQARLYRSTHDTFADYCQSLGFSPQYGYMLENEALISLSVKMSTRVDISRQVARALVCYPGHLRAAIVTVAHNDNDLTARHVKSIGDELMTFVTTGSVNGDTPLGQAVLVTDYEAAMRQREYISERARWKRVDRREIVRGSHKWIVWKMELKP